MDTDNIKNNAHDEKELIPAVCAQEISEPSGEVIFIDERKSNKKKNSGDDVMLTQCILCLILALSVFLLKFISDDFQRELLSMYKEKTNAAPEPFIFKIVETIESWVKR